MACGVVAPHVEAAEDVEPHHLISNFTSPLGNSPTIVTSVDTDNPRVGLGTGRVKYTLTAQQRQADLMLPDEQIRVGGSGTIRLWVKGDGSGNQLLLILRKANIVYDKTGVRRLQQQANISLEPITLDFDDWRDVELDGSAVVASRSAVTWWHRIQVTAPDTPEAKLSGEILLDEFRVVPTLSPPNSTFSVSLLGETIRDYTRDVAVSLDVRNFTKQSARVSVRLTMSDRNDNTVADQDLAVELKPGDSREVKLQLDPDALHAYLPPFRLDGDVLSAELPGVSRKFDYTLVMGNAWLLWDDMSDVERRWRTARFDLAKQRNGWVNWTHGEAGRATPFVETKTRLTRLDRAPGDNASPPGRYAMQVDYQGETAAYVGPERYFPGNAFRAGFWVKGNGTGAKLHALFLDYSNLSGFYGQMWARIPNGEREVCTLDFEGWRFFEVPLPGNGSGTWIPGGSTPEIDFPLELTALRIQPAEEGDSGSVQIGPIMVTSQLSITETLNVHIGYDDAGHEYLPKHGAWLTVHNGWREGVRQINTRWTLLDRDDTVIVSGSERLKVPAGTSSQLRVDLAAHAGKIASRAGPLKLEAVVSDAEDATTAAQRQIILAKPDSRVLLSDFESDRGFLGLRGEGITNAPGDGEAAARTSTAQKHSGQRSLAIEWDKAANVTRFVSIDPPAPGVPSRISVWVFGDGSNVLFYPLIGDQPGIPHGSGTRAWDFFFCRQSAVRVDWQGWKQLTFRLPPIPVDWPDGNVTPWVQDYPLGIHLAVDATEAGAEKGTLFVDDVTLDSHLPRSERLSLQLLRDDETNVFQAGQPLRFRVTNRDASQSVQIKVEGGIFDWRGRAVATVNETIQAAPGQSQIRELSSQLPQGAWQLRVNATPVGADGPLADPSYSKQLIGDIIVADLSPLLGADWRDALRTDWKLRTPIRSRFRYVDEDWDWIEFHPGNFQFDSLRKRAAAVRETGNDPWMLLGFSAYYAAGTGFEQMQAGSFLRRQRDIGHAVDTFLVPKRIEDWDNYTAEIMRAAGKELTGWVLWDNPDGTSSLKVPPSKFSKMLASAAKWRAVYCPETPLLIGGMRPETGLNYLRQLEDVARKKASGAYLDQLELSKEERRQLEQPDGESPETASARVVEARKGLARLQKQRFPLNGFTGINLRMDVGRLSPEDARAVETIDEYRRYLASVTPAETSPKSILITDLDWAVETATDGLGAFEQAAYLARSDLLLHPFGIRPSLDVRNQDHARVGLGTVYRQTLESPPIRQQLQSYQLKPGWWGMIRLRQLLDDAAHVAWIALADEYPGKTRCQLLKRKSNGRFVAVVWRNESSGFVSPQSAGLTFAAAEDVFGTRVTADAGRWPIGIVPTLFTLAASATEPASALHQLRVDDGQEPHWFQRVLASVSVVTGAPGYAQESGAMTTFEASTANGIRETGRMLLFARGGRESITLPVPAGSSVVLRKRYYLDDAGQSADVLVNGKSVGRWDLSRQAQAESLRSGIRSGTFLLDSEVLPDTEAAIIELRYTGRANTISLSCLEYLGGEFPLTTLGAIHADQAVQTPRYARNMVGSPLRIRSESFASGIGCFAPSLLEYSLNGQFSTFRASCGIDAATDGRGSVQFRVDGDGKRLWTSPVMSGLDRAQEIDTNVTGVKRLRLVITDAEDGNRFDAANWCDAVLVR